VARQCSALAIMNLSNGDRDHVPELAGNDLLLETLILLMKDDSPETRRNAATALFNVACADQNTVKLARYKDGLILEVLVQMVTLDGESADENEEARTNAAETLFNMSCSEESETTDRMANHLGLLESLAITLISNDASIEIKMYCAATLRRMAEIIHAPKPSQGALLSALVKASSWTRSACIAEGFAAQAEHAHNRVYMVEHHGLLNALSRLALTTTYGEEMSKIRKAAIASIEYLSREVSTRSILANNEGIMMAMTRASYENNPNPGDPSIPGSVRGDENIGDNGLEGSTFEGSTLSTHSNFTRRSAYGGQTFRSQDGGQTYRSQDIEQRQKKKTKN